ncbi:hypothetical protein BAL199_14862 [alpha proteobacterium BAL199]|nr:hypothetical protein BAL199_14862 [alpha proteobacterium BAL199]
MGAASTSPRIFLAPATANGQHASMRSAGLLMIWQMKQLTPIQLMKS